MGILAVKKLELSEPIERVDNLTEYEGVRFYCFIYGEMLGYLTIWNKGRPIEREELIHEISSSLWHSIKQYMLHNPTDDFSLLEQELKLRTPKSLQVDRV